MSLVFFHALANYRDIFLGNNLENQARGFLSPSARIMGLRLICVLWAVLFLPAYKYGGVSIWGICFGLLLTWLLRLHLAQLVEPIKATPTRMKGITLLLKEYSLISLSISFMGLIPIFALLFLPEIPAQKINHLDMYILNHSLWGVLIKDLNYESSTESIRILLAVSNVSAIMFLAGIFLCASSFFPIAHSIHPDVFENCNGELRENKERSAIISLTPTFWLAFWLVIFLLLKMENLYKREFLYSSSVCLWIFFLYLSAFSSLLCVALGVASINKVYDRSMKGR